MTSLAPSSSSARSAAPARRFERVSNQRPGEQERRHPGGGLEVDVVQRRRSAPRSARRGGSCRACPPSPEERDQRPAERRQHAQRDQRVHRRGAVPQVGPGGAVEGPGRPTRRPAWPAPARPTASRRTAAPAPSPAARPARSSSRGDDAAAGAARRLASRPSVLAAARRRPGSGSRGVVARRLDGGEQVVGRRPSRGRLTRGLLGGVVDRRDDAVELVQLALDPVARRTRRSSR